MKEPRYILTVEVTVNAALALDYALSGAMDISEVPKKLKREITTQAQKFFTDHQAWRKTQFKSAGKSK